MISLAASFGGGVITLLRLPYVVAAIPLIGACFWVAGAFETWHAIHAHVAARVYVTGKTTALRDLIYKAVVLRVQCEPLAHNIFNRWVFHLVAPLVGVSCTPAIASSLL
jgi:hypothetical protein